MAAEWGKRGGRPRKLTLAQYMGESGKSVQGGRGPALDYPGSPSPNCTTDEQYSACCENLSYEDISQPR